MRLPHCLPNTKKIEYKGGLKQIYTESILFPVEGKLTALTPVHTWFNLRGKKNKTKTKTKKPPNKTKADQEFQIPEGDPHVAKKPLNSLKESPLTH